MQLSKPVSQSLVIVLDIKGARTNLLITNGEFALRLLVLLRKCLQFLNRLGLGDCHAEFDVSFCVLVAGLRL